MKILFTLLTLVIITQLSFSQPVSVIDSRPLSTVEELMYVNIPEVLGDLPVDFPVIKVDSLVNPSPGYLFLTTFNIAPNTPTYLLVLDSVAKPLFYQKPILGGIDFKMAPNGLFTYASAIGVGDVHQVGPFKVQNAKVIDYILDSKFNLIDSVQCKNGYLSDTHEFRMLPNGNYMMLSYEVVPVDMSKIVTGGNPNATVIGSVIQELDANKNCIFQWRSLDHIPITQTLDNFLNATFEHVHANAYHLDTDGNLLVSFATTCEIVKIDMTSGKIIWRFGGNQSNFAIKGEHEEFAPLYFRLQHDIKRLPNGNFLFFDDGYGKDPAFSRAVEYSVDEKNRTANLAWEFKHPLGDIATFAMGSAQRLPNGNTLINWGMILSGPFRTVTEVTPDKKIVYELSLPPYYYSYRGLKYQLPACQPVGDVIMRDLLEGNTYKFNSKKSQTGTVIFLETMNAFMYNFCQVKKYECATMNPRFVGEAPVIVPGRFTVHTENIYSFSGEIRFDVSTLPPLYQYDSMKVFFRKTEGNGIFIDIPTTFDPNDNMLVAMASDTGEYIIGFRRESTVINAPVLMSPSNNALLINNQKVNLLWTPTGRYANFVYQIAPDSSFIDQDTLKPTTIETSVSLDLESNKTYYWRVKTNYSDISSDWSPIFSFSTGAPSITITKPVISDKYYSDSIAVIRWKTNISDSVSITLLKNGTQVLVIKNILLSLTNAYGWKVPKTLAEGSDYSIVVKSMKDNNLLATSENFSILKLPSDVPYASVVKENLNITPNPTNGNVMLKYYAQQSGMVQVKIMDMLGTLRSDIIDQFIPEGAHNFNLNLSHLQPGVYLCIVSSHGNAIVDKIVIMK